MPRFVLVLALLAGALSALGEPYTLYVSPRGNDRWSGRLQEPSPEGHDGPSATVDAALAAARKAKSQPSLVREGIAILLRGGVYELDRPIILRPEDSGLSPEQPLILAAFPGEKPVLSGGRKITGWRRVEGEPNLWETEIPDVRDGKWLFRQLFMDGRRKQRARTPNSGFFRIQGPSPQDKPVRIRFQPGDIRPEWAKDGDVELIALLAWADLRMQIRAVDETENVATLSGNPRPSNRENNARYFIENASDGVDSPGEWYLNRRTGRLIYMAGPGEDPTSAEVIAPRLDELLVLSGDLEAKRPVEHVILRGLTFSHTDWTLGEDGYADTQAAVGIRGDIRAEGARHCAVERCTFSHLAGYAIEMSRGCQENRIERNEISDIGAGGIRLGETQRREEEFDRNFGHQIVANHIHSLGRVYPAAVGVFILQSGQNQVAHNHIHDLYYTAISVGWNWGYRETPCRENRIEFNHLHDIGQEMLSDMGAVYTLGIQKGTVIRNNLIHDVNSFTYGGWGLYTDEGSSEIVLENNVVYRTKSAGFHQHYGRDNIVRNNIFAFGKEHQLMRTRAEPHISFIFTNNIVYFDSGTLLGSNWSNDNYRMDGNVYFDVRLKDNLEAMRFAGATFEEWKARGHDRHSILADPLFVNPKEADFRLRPNSPALRLGFQPIDFSSVGIPPEGE